MLSSLTLRASRSVVLLAAILCGAIALAQPRPASAGANAGASAYLTWNAADRTVTDLTTPGVSNSLYIYATAAASKTLTMKGGEIDLTWNPPGDGVGCFDHIGTSYKTSSGTTCTYLNRGSVVPVVTADDPNHFHVAWASNSTFTGCTAGSILQMQFEFDTCADSHGCFTLNACTLLDGINVQDVATIAGKTATVLGGTSFCSASNQPPTINSIANQTVYVGATLVVTPIAADGDGDPLTFSGSGLPGNATVNATTGVLTYTPVTGNQGTYNGVTIAVNDGRGGVASAAFSITVPNRAPAVAAIADVSVTVGTMISVQPTGTDQDGDPLTWSGSNLQSGETVNASTGLLIWTPAASQAGNYPTVLSARDPALATGSASFTIVVNAVPNRAPMVTPVPDLTVNENALLSYQMTATDADGDAITWGLGNNPSGSTLSSTGLFQWTPTYSQAGNYPGIDVTAFDTHGASGVASFAVTVNNVNRAPVVAPIADQSVVAGASLIVTPSGSDADGDALTWSGLNVPHAALIDASTGIFTWTPAIDQVGTYPGVGLLASDGAASGSASFTIFVTSVPNQPPVVVPIADQTVAENALLVVTPAASDADGDPLSWTATNLPGGAIVSAATGVFTWTPSSTQAGSYPGVTLTANDGVGGSGSATFTITVTEVNRVPTVDPILSQVVNAGATLTVQPTGSDPDGDVLAWSGSNLPSGSTVSSSTGLFTWTPSAGQLGNFPNNTLTATDPSGAFGSASFLITVNSGQGNNGAQAWLSWSSSSVVSDLTAPGASTSLYVRVVGANSFKGGELDLTWSPAGTGAGCYDHLSTLFTTSTDCTYLNRGTAVPVTTFDDPNHLHVAWANNAANSTCGSGGNALVLDFEFDGCASTAGCFTMNSLLLLDGANVSSTAILSGPLASVLGGGPACGGVGRFYTDGTSPCTTCDGLSWSTAFHTVTEGIAAMPPNSSADSLFVAEGIYREATFRPAAHKSLLGGYPHGGGTRDLTLHRTVLAPSNNAQSILGLQGDNILLDGFTLTGGRNVPSYGTVMVRGANITMRSLWITGNVNTANPLVFVRGAQSQGVVMDQCIISQNLIGRNACIDVDTGATMTMTDCDVVSDSSISTLGATFLSAVSHVTVTNTAVWAMSPASVPLIYLPQNATVTYSDLATYDPLLCNIAARQFTLQPGSPLINAGLNGTTIGALDAVGCGSLAPPLAAPSLGGEETDGASFTTGLLAVGPSVSAKGSTVGFALASDARVRLDVYNATGRWVTTLADRLFDRGEQAVRWTGVREDGVPVPAGVYVIRFVSGTVRQSTRVVVMR